MLWLKPFYEAVTLPKLDGVAIDGDFSQPPRFFLNRAENINPIDNSAVRPDYVSPVFFIELTATPATLPHRFTMEQKLSTSRPKQKSSTRVGGMQFDRPSRSS